jgi:hypothetical protein
MVWTIHEGLDKYRMQWNGLVHNPLQVSQKKQVHDSTMGWITSVDTLLKREQGLEKILDSYMISEEYLKSAPCRHMRHSGKKLGFDALRMPLESARSTSWSPR